MAHAEIRRTTIQMHKYHGGMVFVKQNEIGKCTKVIGHSPRGKNKKQILKILNARIFKPSMPMAENIKINTEEAAQV